MVSKGLMVLGAVALVGSGRRITEGGGGSEAEGWDGRGRCIDRVLAGLAVEGRLGQRLESPALVADGVLSGSGAVLPALAVVAVTIGTRDQWWWVDPLAAGVIAVLAAVHGTRVLAVEQRRHRSGH